MELKHRVLPRLGLLAALVLLAGLLLSVGTAYARYRTEQQRPISFQTTAESGLSITDSLNTDGSTWIDTVTVSNGSGVELSFTAMTSVSPGIGAMENAVLTFSGGEYVVEGVGTAIAEGSFLYDSFGPGWYYRYPNVRCTLDDGETMTIEIHISPGTVINEDTGEEEPATFPENSVVRTELIIEH